MGVNMRKFNPGFMTDDELVESFCVRTNEFEAAIEALRECDGNANPHRIVIGPRGSGKTCLLLRIAAELRRDRKLSNCFIPVVFAEESYEVATAGEFWLECLSRLAKQAPRSEHTPDLWLTVGELRTIRNDKELGDRCLGALLDFADREEKRLVLFVENLNMIFGDMMDGHAGWRLRHILQTEPRIFLLASATSRFDEIDSPDRALHDLFRIVLLRPLDTEECAVLWERVSGRNRTHGTIEALRILTGGNPRLLAIVARFGAGLSFRELMADLLDLVDDHTEYFKSHLGALPAQERRVYLALADLWKPATAREISDRARLDTSKCSAQLARLTDRGAVEVVGGGSRRKQYYLTERLYNIYYLLRRSRGPEPLIEALVRFMEAYYSTGELKEFGVRLAWENSVETAVFQRKALNFLLDLPTLAEHRDDLLASFPKELLEEPTRGFVPSNGVKIPLTSTKSEPSDTRQADERATKLEELESIQFQLGEAVALAEQHRNDEALAKCEEITCQLGVGATDLSRVLVAHALNLKGLVLLRILASTDACRPIKDELHNDQSDNNPPPSHLAVPSIAERADRSSLLPKALDTFDSVVRLYGGSDIPALLEPVLIALNQKGNTLLNLQRPDEALANFDDVISRSRKSSNSSYFEASAHLMKGFVLLEEGRAEEALVAFGTAASLFKETAVPSSPKMAVLALTQEASTLEAVGQLEEALTSFDDVLRQCNEDKTSEMREIAAIALDKKGQVLGKLNRVNEALASRDELLHRYGHDDAPIFQEMSARSLFLKGELLQRAGRQEEALTAFDEVVRRFKSSTVHVILEVVASALARKGELLLELNRLDEALTSWDNIKNQFGALESPAFFERVAAAMLRKGLALHESSRLTEALCAFDNAARHASKRNTKNIVAIRATAHASRGIILSQLDRPKEALKNLGKAAQMYEQCERPKLRGLTGLVLVERAAAEMNCGRFTAALESASRALAPDLTLSMDLRLQAHVIRARAAVADGKSSLCVPDIESILEILPELGPFPKTALNTLMWASVWLGEERVLELVRASPSAGLLLPLSTALQQELGGEPRVAREVEEVALDIRRELAEMRKQTASRPQMVGNDP